MREISHLLLDPLRHSHYSHALLALQRFGCKPFVCPLPDLTCMSLTRPDFIRSLWIQPPCPPRDLVPQEGPHLLQDILQSNPHTCHWQYNYDLGIISHTIILYWIATLSLETLLSCIRFLIRNKLAAWTRCQAIHIEFREAIAFLKFHKQLALLVETGSFTVSSFPPQMDQYRHKSLDVNNWPL